MKTLFLALLALPFISQAEPRAAANVAQPTNADYVRQINVDNTRSYSEEINPELVQSARSNYDQVFRRYLRFGLETTSEEERIAEMAMLGSRALDIVVFRNPLNSNPEFQSIYNFVGLRYWNRQIRAYIEQEIARGVISPDIVQKYIHFKESQVWQNVERQVLNEFNYQTAERAERDADPHTIYEINAHIIYYMIHDHPEQLRELESLIRKIFPILARTLEPQEQPTIPEETPATR